ncbi:chemotaxis protein CheW [Telmatobacter sp. DSM 110680]|uniref:histidine kinase n=1 Tax=Telmatobacter sp. DSM 110680 TaxID=3036704 RepID=A0AAU7DIL5_9BACT
MDELTREFLIESQEGLDRMEHCLTDLEKRPEDAALIAEIFRSVHTIKGTTGFLGYKRLEKLSHAGESLLGQLRDGKLSATDSVVTVLLQLLDGLRSILRAIEANETEGAGEDSKLIAQLEQLQRMPAAVSTSVSNSAVRRPRKKAEGEASSRSYKAEAAAPLAIKPIDVFSPPPVSETERSASALAAENVSYPLLPEIATQERETSTTHNAVVVAASESTLRVDVDLLNRMMNLVGELVLTRNQVLQASTAIPSLTQLSRRLDMVTADLRESVMKARMQPVSNVFSKIPRMVRDLSHGLGRRVRLELEGQDTGLDKSLLEAIKDPLTHAVRNALDHGIEAPDVRIAAGKNPEGLLRVRAIQEGSHVIIEVSDDGAGISVERVRAKAIERNLISAECSAQQSDHELLQLVFLPGFSTAAVVTNVSGRGVGMDVVRTNVEKIGGKVELDSHPGRGTTLRLRIPLTLAIIPALIVRSVGQSFALPQAALSELVHIAQGESSTSIEWMEDTPLYRLRGNLLPLVFLDRLLAPGTVHGPKNLVDGYIAVLEADGRRFGLVVDGLADPEEIVVKALNVALKNIGLYSGATVLGSGNLALILDPTAIAIRAGIAMNEVDLVAPADVSVPQDVSGDDYLLVDIGGRRSAVVLKDVVRIEQLAASRVEHIGCRPVLNFEGQILSIEDPAALLAVAETDPSAQVVVVICQDEDRQVGFVVCHVLDVAAGTDLFEAGSSRPSEGVMLLENRVTELVDLTAVPALSNTETDLHSCQFAEALS